MKWSFVGRAQRLDKQLRFFLESLRYACTVQEKIVVQSPWPVCFETLKGSSGKTHSPGIGAQNSFLNFLNSASIALVKTAAERPWLVCFADATWPFGRVHPPEMGVRSYQEFLKARRKTVGCSQRPAYLLNVKGLLDRADDGRCRSEHS